MKAEEVLRRYAAGERNFSGANLQRCNFKGQNLSDANFSYADIRSTNFTEANLSGANFTRAKAGLQRRWVVFQTIVASLLLPLLNFTSTAIIVGVVAYLLSPEGIKQFTIFPSIAAVIAITVVFLAIARQGFTVQAMGTIAVAVAVAVAEDSLIAVESVSAFALAPCCPPPAICCSLLSDD